MFFRTLNPTTGELLEELETISDEELEARIARAENAFANWRHVPITERAKLLEGAAQLLESRAPQYAELMATEMGKPVTEGEAEVRKCALACDYFAEKGAEFLRSESDRSGGIEAWVAYEPLGVLLAIMPWNFPFWQVFRHAAPSLIAGNVVLMKHAPNTPRCARAIEQLMLDSGFPEHVLQNLYISNEQAEKVIGDRRVAGVTLTGSTRAGREVATASGRHLKKTVLELGGSDPFIVMADADLEHAAETAAASRCLNSGQSCISAKRFLVQESIFGEFTKRFVEEMEKRVPGDPLNPQTKMGPLARADLRDNLVRQVQASLHAGARTLLGGEVPDGPGYFHPPTVLTAVKPGTPAWDEELFGPVAAVIPFRDEEQMLTIANGTRYGLGASLWTTSPAKARELAPRLEAGSVFVNELVKSDPRFPFGGIKESGYGRELGREGVREWVNIKTVWLR